MIEKKIFFVALMLVGGSGFAQGTTNIQAENSSSGNIDWIQLSIYAFLLSIIIYLLMKIKRWLKIKKLKKALNEKYNEDLSSIGQFKSDDAYITAHLQSLGNKKSAVKDVKSGMKKMNLPLVKCTTHSQATWQAEIGTVDTVSFNHAISSYKIAKQHWEIARANLPAVEQVRFRNEVSPPISPSEKKFVTYHFHEEPSSIDLNHNWIIANTSEILEIDNVGEIKLNIDKKLEKTILSIYENLLEKFTDFTKSFELNTQNDTITLESNEEFILSKLNDEIESAFTKEAKRKVGKYYNNLKIVNTTTTIEYNSRQLLPIVIVATKVGQNSPKITVHDHLVPEIILD